MDDNYKTFILTLINDKSSLSYDEVLAALVNHELRQNDKESSNSTSTEASTVREKSFNRKGKSDHGRSKSKNDLKKKHYAFCKEEGH